jgi:hypothetical protein
VPHKDYPLRDNPAYHDREQLCLTRGSGTWCCSSSPPTVFRWSMGGCVEGREVGGGAAAE